MGRWDDEDETHEENKFTFNSILTPLQSIKIILAIDHLIREARAIFSSQNGMKMLTLFNKITYALP